MVASNVALDRETEFILQGSYATLAYDEVKAKWSQVLENPNKWPEWVSSNLSGPI